MNFDVKRCHDRILIPDFPLMLPQINQKLELRASAPSPASIYFYIYTAAPAWGCETTWQIKNVLARNISKFGRIAPFHHRGGMKAGNVFFKTLDKS